MNVSLSPSIYRVLKNHAPRVHSFLGRATRRWRHNDPWTAIPRRFCGRWVWLHPQMFGEDLWSQEGHFLFPWIQRYLAPGGVFFDVGAHWGLVSLFATRTAGKVIAFEASPLHVKTLNYHRKVNGLSDVIEVAPCAVTHETTAATPFYLVDGGKSWSNSLTIGDDSTPFIRPEMKTAISAPTISLDDFSCQSGHVPDVIKIDVEGAEQWVIEGAQHTLRTCRPVLIVSIHEFWMPAKQSETTLLNLLFRIGYRIAEDHVSSGNGVQVRDVVAVAP